MATFLFHSSGLGTRREFRAKRFYASTKVPSTLDRKAERIIIFIIAGRMDHHRNYERCCRLIFLLLTLFPRLHPIWEPKFHPPGLPIKSFPHDAQDGIKYVTAKIISKH